MHFAGFAVLFKVDLQLVLPTCLHSTVTVAGMHIPYIYCSRVQKRTIISAQVYFCMDFVSVLQMLNLMTFKCLQMCARVCVCWTLEYLFLCKHCKINKILSEMFVSQQSGAFDWSSSDAASCVPPSAPCHVFEIAATSLSWPPGQGPCLNSPFSLAGQF